mgnify:CR=1 FL=1
MASRRSPSTAKRGRSLLGQSLVLGVVAGGIASLLLGEGYLAYVKPGMRWPLVASVVVLAVLALATANRADRLDDELIDEDNRRYSALAMMLRARFLVDVDCWSEARGQPIKPGSVVDVALAQMKKHKSQKA